MKRPFHGATSWDNNRLETAEITVGIDDITIPFNSSKDPCCYQRWFVSGEGEKGNPALCNIGAGRNANLPPVLLWQRPHPVVVMGGSAAVGNDGIVSGRVFEGAVGNTQGISLEGNAVQVKIPVLDRIVIPIVPATSREGRNLGFAIKVETNLGHAPLREHHRLAKLYLREYTIADTETVVN